MYSRAEWSRAEPSRAEPSHARRSTLQRSSAILFHSLPCSPTQSVPIAIHAIARASETERQTNKSNKPLHKNHTTSQLITYNVRNICHSKLTRGWAKETANPCRETGRLYVWLPYIYIYIYICICIYIYIYTYIHIHTYYTHITCLINYYITLCRTIQCYTINVPSPLCGRIP